MKETGLLFTPENYTKSENGSKTVTRRIIKPQPPCECEYLINGAHSHALCRSIKYPNLWVCPTAKSKDHRLKCPYGTVGDKLYVKEAWCHACDPITSKLIEGVALYKRDGHETFLDDGDGYAVLNKDGSQRSPWKSPLFMPKWAARLWLEIVGVRVEQLGEMTEEDARAEGVKSISEFIELWKSINDTWEPSLWVWCLEYKLINP